MEFGLVWFGLVWFGLVWFTFRVHQSDLEVVGKAEGVEKMIPLGLPKSSGLATTPFLAAAISPPPTHATSTPAPSTAQVHG